MAARVGHACDTHQQATGMVKDPEPHFGPTFCFGRGRGVRPGAPEAALCEAYLQLAAEVHALPPATLVPALQGPAGARLRDDLRLDAVAWELDQRQAPPRVALEVGGGNGVASRWGDVGQQRGRAQKPPREPEQLLPSLILS